MKVIIPCAGFGTRVGMAPNESKEMLLDPEGFGPIIDYAIDIARAIGATPTILSRPEKEDLNIYLRTKQNIEPILYTPTGEWMHTVIASRPYWDDTNMLILPDTRWHGSVYIAKQLKFQVEQMNAPLALGMHEVVDPTKWCVRGSSTPQHNMTMYEKPKENGSNWAFGIIAWKWREGLDFFKALADFKAADLPIDSQFIKIEHFIDLTRGDYQLTKYESNDTLEK